MKTGRRLRVKLYVMTCSHWLSASNRFITPYAHHVFYNIFCHFFNKVQQERWYRWHNTKRVIFEYSLHTSDFHLSLPTATQFRSKSRDEFWHPHGTFHEKHCGEVHMWKKTGGFPLTNSDFNFHVKIKAADWDSDISGCLS